MGVSDSRVERMVGVAEGAVGYRGRELVNNVASVLLCDECDGLCADAYQVARDAIEWRLRHPEAYGWRGVQVDVASLAIRLEGAWLS